jgi:hypothetical protein
MKNSKYGLYALVLFGYLIFSQYLLERLGEPSFYVFHPHFILIFVLIPIYLILGLLLGIEHLLCKVIIKEGRLTYDYVKAIYIGIPALLFSFYPILYFSGLPITGLISLILLKEPLTMCASIILGYVIITSLKRV